MVDDRLVICVRIDGRDGCICVVLVQKRSEGGQLECNITLTSWLAGFNQYLHFSTNYLLY